MVKRTADGLMVSEDELATAVAIIESACRGACVEVEPEISDYVDLDAENGARTLITAHVTAEQPAERIVERYPRIAALLRDRHLLHPERPLLFVLSPRW